MGASRLVYVVLSSEFAKISSSLTNVQAEITFLMGFRGSSSLRKADISLDYGAVWVDHVN